MTDSMVQVASSFTESRFTWYRALTEHRDRMAEEWFRAMTEEINKQLTTMTYAVVVSDPGCWIGLDCIQHLTPDLDEARAVAACDLGDRVDIYRIFPDHYEWVETYVENRLISDV